MIDFDTIGLHDLVELEASMRFEAVEPHVVKAVGDGNAGWYFVDWISQAWGERLIEVEKLGSHDEPRKLQKGDANLIRRHIRAVDIPAMVDALESVAVALDTAYGLTKTS